MENYPPGVTSKNFDELYGIEPDIELIDYDFNFKDSTLDLELHKGNYVAHDSISFEIVPDYLFFAEEDETAELIMEEFEDKLELNWIKRD